MIYATAAGNIGKDAEVRRLQDGTAVASFSLATEQRIKGEKVTTWLDVSIWGKRGEALAPHLTKGGKVTVVGALSTREYEGKTYLQIRADEVALQGGGQSGGQRREGQQLSEPVNAYSAAMDDEIPFAPETRV